MRARLILPVAALAGATVAVVPALARQETKVTAQPDFTWTPANVTIDPGQTVTWANGGGTHNVRFDDGSFEQPPSPSSAAWTVERRFDTAGTFGYRCGLHSSMRGSVIVGGGGTPTPTPSPTPSPSPSPAPTATPYKPPSLPPRLRITKPRGSFCLKRSRRCRKPGIRLAISASSRGTVSGSLSRRSGSRLRRLGTIRASVPTGRSTLKLTRTRERRRIGAGRYSLTLTLVSPGQPASTPQVVAFTVR